MSVSEFFDVNHGPNPGHPYYQTWYNKFIRKPSAFAEERESVGNNYRDRSHTHLDRHFHRRDEHRHRHHPAKAFHDSDFRVGTPTPPRQYVKTRMWTRGL